MKTTVLFFLATLVATSHATCLSNSIRLHGDMALEDCIPKPIHVLRPDEETDCRSWQFLVETNNLRDWKTVPADCIHHVRDYMEGKDYSTDCNRVVDIAIKYAENVPPSENRTDIWVFEIGETALSNLPYYRRADVNYGEFPFNSTKFNEWVAEGLAPPVPGVPRLHKRLGELGFKSVFLTGLHKYQKKPVSSNLIRAGYTTWEKIIFKPDLTLTNQDFKSLARLKLVLFGGYRIIGNIGDQWSDITGLNVGMRTFKLPNPMYYVA